MKRMAETYLTGPMRFETNLSTGHGIVMDAAEDVGGENSAPRPYHLVLAALSGCTGMDVISVLRKKRQNVTKLWIEIDAEQSEEFPKVFTKIHIHYHLAGESLDPTAVARAIELSETKYCPVQENLRGRAEISSEFTLYDAGTST
jgi:putative redox protein